MTPADLSPPSGARSVDDPAELVEFFADAPAVHLYALVDLEEPFWTASRWFRRGDAVVGVVATPSDGIITATGVSTRDPGGSLVLLAEVAAELPPGIVLTGPIGLAAALIHHRPAADAGRHVKYELRRRPDADVRGQTPIVRSSGVAVEPLHPVHVDELLELYATDPGAAFFLPSMLGDRSFVGIRGDGGRLVAAGGTHVVSDRQRLAAIGSILVRPDARGRGFGRAIVCGVIERLAGRCDVIGLNVAADNVAARAVYDTLGFAPVLDYDEAVLA